MVHVDVQGCFSWLLLGLLCGALAISSIVAAEVFTSLRDIMIGTYLIMAMALCLAGLILSLFLLWVAYVVKERKLPDL